MQSDDLAISARMLETLEAMTELCRALIDELGQYKAVDEEEKRLADLEER